MLMLLLMLLLLRPVARPLARAAYRLDQCLDAVTATVPADRDAILAAVLTSEQATAFRALPPHDQAHLCRVYRAIIAQGPASNDLQVAALLHDIAKAGPQGRVRLHDRIAHVVLRRLAPRALARLARLPAPPWRAGLALAVHHPHLGADQARALGCSPRACWLISRHADPSPSTDPDLHRLIAADHTAA